MLDYETLRLIWWVLLGVLLIGFAIMDGFDLGAMALLPVLGKSDAERRVLINTVGPVWEGNQVWLILGAGAIFAAWPYIYAVAFSGFYLAMFLVLCTLILRPVSMKFRSKLESQRWRSVWDAGLFISGAVPPIIFGVAVGNALQGAPFTFDQDMRMTYTGSFFDLLNPFALLAGVVSLSMILTQGATWLAVKTDGALLKRASAAAQIGTIVTLALFAGAGVWIAQGIDGYAITSALTPDGPSNPLLKTATKITGGWLANYQTMPVTMAAPALALLGALLVIVGMRAKKHLLAFAGSSVMIAGIIGTAGVSMFPFILPSSLNPAASLTVWDASSSQMTLMIMTVATAIFMPIILAYTSWVYHVLRGKVTADFVAKNSDGLY